VGTETGFGSYVTAYSVLQVGSQESRGQLLAGAYWAAIMVGRFASIWVASLISASLFLRLSMTASAVWAVFLLVAGGSDAGLWVGSIGFGLAMACVYPTTLSLVETFFPVLGRHVTCIMIGSATGEMALPFVIATLFGGSSAEDRSPGQSPQVLMWVVAIACALNAALLFLLLHLGKGVQARVALEAAPPQQLEAA
jgi:FHS family Na+ dependent glucose MFS transporter 1